ncbi:MAG: protein-tyrosine phosphatase [Actinomycetota bacterium]|nr:protein-tyrosine phosphatase [Actinomycetota bacterium]
MASRAVTPPVERVLFVCRANACRSPVAAELFRRHIGRASVAIASAGTDARDVDVRADALEALAAAGVDLASHRSELLTVSALEESDIVVAMERAVVRSAVVLMPSVWPRTFTLKELVRRAESIGPRATDEPIARWVARVHDGRTTTDMQGDDRVHDVNDPYAGPRRGYAKLVAELDSLTAAFAHLGWGERARAPSGRR